MQHRLKKTVMGVATGEDETEIHPEFPQREAEYTAPTTAVQGKSSYGWHHGNKHLANAKGLQSGWALLRNPQLPCCQGVYPPNQAHEAAVGMSRLHEKRWEGSVPDVAAAQGEGETKVFLVPDWSHGVAPENYGGKVID